MTVSTDDSSWNEFISGCSDPDRLNSYYSWYKSTFLQELNASDQKPSKQRGGILSRKKKSADAPIHEHDSNVEEEDISRRLLDFAFLLSEESEKQNSELKLLGSHRNAAYYALRLFIDRLLRNALQFFFKNCTAETSNYNVLKVLTFQYQHWLTGRCSPNYSVELIENLFRAAGITFLSCHIMKYLFHTLRTMHRYKEASLAFENYRSRINQFVESEQFINEDTVHNSWEMDSDAEIAKTFSLGVRFYAVNMRNIEKASEIEQECHKFIETHKLTENGHLQAHIWHSAGITRSVKAENSRGEQRIVEQKAARDALLKSLSYQDNPITLYHLALQYTALLDYREALKSVKQLLRISPFVYPAYHLLALLNVGLGKYENAIKACNLACKRFQDSENNVLPWHEAMDNFVSLQYICVVKMYAIKLMHQKNLEMTLSKEVFDLISNTLKESFENFGHYFPHIGLSDKNTESKQQKIHMPKDMCSLGRKAKKSGSIQDNTTAQSIQSSLEEYHNHSAKQQTRCAQHAWMSYAIICRDFGMESEMQEALAEAREFESDTTEVDLLELQLQKNYADTNNPVDIQQAAIMLRKLHFNDPDNEAVQVALAHTYLKQHEIGNSNSLLYHAEDLLNNAAQGKAWSNPEAWYYLGKIRHYLGNDDAAEKSFLFALQMDRKRLLKSWTDIYPGYILFVRNKPLDV